MNKDYFAGPHQPTTLPFLSDRHAAVQRSRVPRLWYTKAQGLVLGAVYLGAGAYVLNEGRRPNTTGTIASYGTYTTILALIGLAMTLVNTVTMGVIVSAITASGTTKLQKGKFTLKWLNTLQSIRESHWGWGSEIGLQLWYWFTFLLYGAALSALFKKSFISYTGYGNFGKFEYATSAENSDIRTAGEGGIPISGVLYATIVSGNTYMPTNAAYKVLQASRYSACGANHDGTMTCVLPVGIPQILQARDRTIGFSIYNMSMVTATSVCRNATRETGTIGSASNSGVDEITYDNDGSTTLVTAANSRNKFQCTIDFKSVYGAVSYSQAQGILSIDDFTEWRSTPYTSSMDIGANTEIARDALTYAATTVNKTAGDMLAGATLLGATQQALTLAGLMSTQGGFSYKTESISTFHEVNKIKIEERSPYTYAFGGVLILCGIILIGVAIIMRVHALPLTAANIAAMCYGNTEAGNFLNGACASGKPARNTMLKLVKTVDELHLALTPSDSAQNGYADLDKMDFRRGRFAGAMETSLHNAALIFSQQQGEAVFIGQQRGNGELVSCKGGIVNGTVIAGSPAAWKAKLKCRGNNPMRILRRIMLLYYGKYQTTVTRTPKAKLLIGNVTDSDESASSDTPSESELEAKKEKERRPLRQDLTARRNRAFRRAAIARRQKRGSIGSQSAMEWYGAMPCACAICTDDMAYAPVSRHGMGNIMKEFRQRDESWKELD